MALGFVLIFKASGVFNFAQGVMVLFAALTLVGLMERGAPVVLALVLTMAVMVALAFAIERVVLRPLVNQEHIILFMATIGLNFFLEGFGEMLWGANVKRLDVGIPDTLVHGRGRAGQPARARPRRSPPPCWSRCWRVFFQRTRIGRALRAVADDHEAALSIGIPLKTIWVVVWSVAGLVALVAGVMWGAKSGVQFSLSLIALKALPVLILGGFTSVPGAIVGGLIIGVGEKLAEVYWGPLVGGAIENWFAYVLALGFLLFRPQGLFGEKIIERSRRRVIYREARAVQDAPTRSDQAIFPDPSRIGVRRRRLRWSSGGVPPGAASLRRQRVLAAGGADPVPDLRAGRARPESAHGLCRAALARHRRLHGGGRLLRRSSSPPRSRASTSCWSFLLAGLVAAARSGCSSASRACASRASTWRWPRWPPSSS